MAIIGFLITIILVILNYLEILSLSFTQLMLPVAVGVIFDLLTTAGILVETVNRINKINGGK